MKKPSANASDDVKARPERICRDEAALVLGVPGRTVSHLAAAGRIPGAAKIGRLWTFDEVKLRAWVRSKEDEIWARGEKPRRPTAAATPFRRHPRTMPWDVDEAYERVKRRLLKGA